MKIEVYCTPLKMNRYVVQYILLRRTKIGGIGVQMLKVEKSSQPYRHISYT